MLLAEVRVEGRLTLPQWGSIRLRPLACTYGAPPCGPSVRVDGLTKSRQIPTRKTLPLFHRGDQGILPRGGALPRGLERHAHPHGGVPSAVTLQSRNRVGDCSWFCWLLHTLSPWSNTGRECGGAKEIDPATIDPKIERPPFLPFSLSLFLSFSISLYLPPPSLSLSPSFSRSRSLRNRCASAATASRAPSSCPRASTPTSWRSAGTSTRSSAPTLTASRIRSSAWRHYRS